MEVAAWVLSGKLVVVVEVVALGVQRWSLDCSRQGKHCPLAPRAWIWLEPEEILLVGSCASDQIVLE